MRLLFLSIDNHTANPVYDELVAALESDPKNRVVRADFKDFLKYFEPMDRDQKAPLPPEVTFIDLKDAYTEEAVRAIMLVSKKIETVVYAVNTDIWQHQALRASGMLFVGPEDMPKAIDVIRQGWSIERPPFDPLF